MADQVFNTTSGSRAYTQSRDGLIGLAYKKNGVGLTQSIKSDQFQHGAELLELISHTWQAMGVLLWTKIFTSINLTPNTVDYVLRTDETFNIQDEQKRNITDQDNNKISYQGGEFPPFPYIEICDFFLRRAGTQEDYPVNVISRTDYINLAFKTDITGIVDRVYIERNLDTYGRLLSTLHVYPNPDQGDTLFFSGVQLVQDSGDGATTPDMPSFAYLALVDELAYRLSHTLGKNMDERAIFKADAKESFMKAVSGNIETGDLHISPRRRKY